MYLARFREWRKRRKELKQHQKEAVRAFERIPHIEVTTTKVTSLEESASISYALNKKQLEYALKKGKWEEAAATLVDLGEIVQRYPEIADDFHKNITPKEKAIIRKEIVRYSIPSFMRHPLKRMKEALHTFKKGFGAYAAHVGQFIFSITSIPSWIKAHQHIEEAYAIPSEENIRKAGLQNMVAIFDTLTLGVLMYFVYDFTRDLNQDLFLLKTAGLLTAKAVAHKVALALAAKTFAVVSLDAFKTSEQRRFESQLVALKTIEVLVAALGARDEYTRGHAERVSEYSEWIARELGLTEREVLMVRYAAKLHDIGKLSIPDAILLKEGKVSEDEYNVIKRHPLVGYVIASQITEIDEILLGILQHHEKLDGSGYYGAKGDEIHLSARILSVADIFDAIVSDRPYHKGKPADTALGILHEMASGRKLDGDVVEAFAKAYSRIMQPVQRID